MKFWFSVCNWETESFATAPIIIFFLVLPSFRPLAGSTWYPRILWLISCYEHNELQWKLELESSARVSAHRVPHFHLLFSANDYSKRNVLSYSNTCYLSRFEIRECNLNVRKLSSNLLKTHQLNGAAIFRISSLTWSHTLNHNVRFKDGFSVVFLPLTQNVKTH